MHDKTLCLLTFNFEYKVYCKNKLVVLTIHRGYHGNKQTENREVHFSTSDKTT